MVTRYSACICVCVKPGPFLSSCSRELVFPDLGVAGAASSCSSTAHANSMNHFPSFQSTEIKAYGGRKRRGGMFYLDLYHHSIKLHYQAECGKKEKILYMRVCRPLSDREWTAVKIKLSQPWLDCFSCLGSSWAVSVVILSMCMEAHRPWEKQRGTTHGERSPREYQACMECFARTQVASLHCLSLDLRSADKICPPPSSFKVMKCLSLPSPPGYRWRGPISPSE